MLKCYICETEVVNLDAHVIECHNLENDFDLEENESSQENITTERHFCYLKKCKGGCEFNPTLDKIQAESPDAQNKSVQGTKKTVTIKFMTPEQIKYLKTSYAINKYCTSEERIKLSQLSSVPERSIQMWFWRQRHKEKDKSVQDTKKKGKQKRVKPRGRISYTPEQIKYYKEFYQYMRYIHNQKLLDIVYSMK